MSQIENPNIEELLNGYIDGELTERENTEVQRLVSHDAQVAQRLRELQTSKILVSSLPRAEAPSRILDNVKASLETEAVSDERDWNEEPSGGRVGVRHLMVRKFLAAAAMIGLVAILGSVVYTIVVPESHDIPPVPEVAFDGRLELKTDALSMVNTFIERAIEEKGLSDSIRVENRSGKRVYSLTCSQKDLNLLLAGLTDVWEKCNSTTLSAKIPVEKEFDNVSTERIITIVDDLIPVKPSLTEDVNEDENTTSQQKTKKQVRLSIVVGGSE
ncbi:MAG: hypothetical protein GWN67_16635 [Phycisphaerae bacterium]|nr:hypothetical protein [Phycisphaerae bacterium]NIR67484.1 hypothetical protein [candidate division Zixibacteria bacterium]NIS52781.1 hypothetical protein [Phycisphaerae bacterium]NIU08237.1 hypothetical protein [Phycisphaerae bacterium]NIU57955.1 hypothetical protein [Phycisphaerae bacterium]